MLLYSDESHKRRVHKADISCTHTHCYENYIRSHIHSILCTQAHPRQCSCWHTRAYSSWVRTYGQHTPCQTLRSKIRSSLSSNMWRKQDFLHTWFFPLLPFPLEGNYSYTVNLMRFLDYSEHYSSIRSWLPPWQLFYALFSYYVESKLGNKRDIKPF